MAIPCIGLSSHSLLSMLHLNLLYYPNLWMTGNRLVSTKKGVLLSVFLMFIHQTYGKNRLLRPKWLEGFEQFSRSAWAVEPGTEPFRCHGEAHHSILEVKLLDVRTIWEVHWNAILSCWLESLCAILNILNLYGNLPKSSRWKKPQHLPSQVWIQ